MCTASFLIGVMVGGGRRLRLKATTYHPRNQLELDGQVTRHALLTQTRGGQEAGGGGGGALMSSKVQMPSSGSPGVIVPNQFSLDTV